MPIGNQNTSGAKGRNADFQRGVINLLKGNKSFGSYTLSSGTYTITAKDRLSTISIYLASGGAGTIQGDATIPAFGGVSTAIAINPEVPTIINCAGGINYAQIIISSGTAEIMCN